MDGQGENIKVSRRLPNSKNIKTFHVHVVLVYVKLVCQCISHYILSMVIN